MLKLAIIVFAALLTVALTGELKLHDCANHEVLKVDVDGCSGDYCVLHKSKPLHFAAEFVANQDTNKIEVIVMASLNGLNIRVPNIETDGCKVVKCPLKKGTKYAFEYTMNIPSIAPLIKSNITFKSIGDHGPISCIQFAGEIQA